MRLITFTVLFGLMVSLANPFLASAASMDYLRGRILLQVEENGEAWYVLPTATERFYVKNGEAAYAAMSNFGLGITNADLWKIPLGVSTLSNGSDGDNDGLADKLEEALGTESTVADSDRDGYSDLQEINAGYSPLGTSKLAIDQGLVNRLRGYVLLQVESKGEAWYVNPIDGKRYYMADGNSAYDIMRSLSLGITNDNLSHIPLYSGVVDCDENIDCMIGSIEQSIDVTGVIVSEISLLEIPVKTWSRLDYQAKQGSDGRYSWTYTILRQDANGVPYADSVGLGQSCRSTQYSDLIDTLEAAKSNNFSSDVPATLLCESFTR